MADLKEMLQEIRERTTPEQEYFVDQNMAIVDYIYQLLEEKKMKPVDLARNLGKTPAEISKWLSGTHNLTLQSISKIESALGEKIIMTPAQAKSKYETVKYVTLKVYSNPDVAGIQSSEPMQYESYDWFKDNCKPGNPVLKLAS